MLPSGGVARMAKKYKKEAQFKTRWYHRMPRYWFEKALVRPEGVREAPEVFRLDVAPGVKANNKPPVRIFLGTEAGQFRAERVFVWSVMQVRDPARVYEIYFMKDLKGYDRTGWKTGFTNYRYGIPAMGGGKGRAIYNDVDQLYLADPGEMFDLDMGGAGMLCITERETSVMLIDCEKMIKYWTLDHAQHGKKHRFLPRRPFMRTSCGDVCLPNGMHGMTSLRRTNPNASILRPCKPSLGSHFRMYCATNRIPMARFGSRASVPRTRLASAYSQRTSRAAAMANCLSSIVSCITRAERHLNLPAVETFERPLAAQA